jgi:hypothetical protein
MGKNTEFCPDFKTIEKVAKRLKKMVQAHGNKS